MKTNTVPIIITILLIGGIIMLTKSGPSQSDLVQTNNVNIVNGKQIVEISAKGGYVPRQSVAKAGIPTIIRFNTRGTFDCSASVLIPSLNISKLLPQNGSTDINIGTAEPGTLNGSCGMGMYFFEIAFSS